MGRAINLAFALFAAGCANPLNEATANRYSQMCREAEVDRRLGGAEEACRRALINVRIGHLGPQAESEALYNLGRIKRQLRKFDEAEELYKEALKVQETVSPADQAKIGRRLAELAAVYGQTSRFKEGWPFVERLMPISSTYSGQERVFAKLVFQTYAQEYRKLGMELEASQLEEKAKSL
jgi:tetratricopeptide (TPR) repeat protein